jgi:hypothetical protein
VLEAGGYKLEAGKNLKPEAHQHQSWKTLQLKEAGETAKNCAGK